MLVEENKRKQNKIKSHLPITKVNRSWKEKKKYKLFIHLRRNGGFKRGKTAFVSNEKEIGEGKKKRIVHPLQRKERLERKIISIDSKKIKNKKLKKKKWKKKCIHEKQKDSWKERGKKIVYPF